MSAPSPTPGPAAIESGVAESDRIADWPVSLEGVTESVVTTLGPNGRWNLAALGLHADDVDEPLRAVTWGDTRTRRNFHRQGGGVVQFVTDPRTFVDAALSVREEDDPIVESAAAWVAIEVTCIDRSEVEGTRREAWTLHPKKWAIRERVVPTINRGFAAVVEATVAASRLDVDAYDTETLRDRLAYFAETVERCGGPRERAAFERLSTLTDWRGRDGTNR